MTQNGSANRPVPSVAIESSGRGWSGRALEAALRFGGLAFVIVLVIVIFTLLVKPKTFLTVSNGLGSCGA